MKTRYFYLFIILTSGFWSCSKDLDETLNQKEQIGFRSGRVAGRSQLLLDISAIRSKGKFNNPYYIGTIRQAYNTLRSSGQVTTNYNFSGNSLYIRYLPKDEDELYLLESNQNIEVFEYPLQENDININSDYSYDDPELAEGQLPFQYNVCNFNGILPNIEVDILDTLFLNDRNPVFSDSDWKKIEAQALVSTGNLNLNDVESFIFCNSWNPSGTILVWDDAVQGNIPVKKVKVKASKWFKLWTGFTDNDGHFILPDFCGEVTYSLIWENSIWDIRNGNGGQATTQGPKQKAPWNPVIKDDKKALGFATVHRALVRYIFEDVANLYRPLPQANAKLKVKYKHESGDVFGLTHTSGFEGFFTSNVIIYGFSGNVVRPTNELFSTTAHELGHVAHAFQMGNIQFWQVSSLLTESWARACQWKVTTIEYTALGALGLPTDYMQNWSFSSNAGDINNYTPLFIDLEDSFNQNPTNSSSLPFDGTSSYDLARIQHLVLSDSYGLTSLRTKLKSERPSGVSEADIDSNMDYYFTHF